jgi:hypothetical protein
MGEFIDEPALGHPLHPNTYEGDQLANEKEAEVAMTKGSESGS